MKQVIMIRYAEMWLKGKNKGFFERAFENNLRRAIKPFQCQLVKQSGRYIVENFNEEEFKSVSEHIGLIVKHYFPNFKESLNRFQL